MDLLSEAIRTIAIVKVIIIELMLLRVEYLAESLSWGAIAMCSSNLRDASELATAHLDSVTLERWLSQRQLSDSVDAAAQVAGIVGAVT